MGTVKKITEVIMETRTEYEKMILKELESIPEGEMPKLYKAIHLITSEFISRG